jgi:hypothetical protein
LPKSVEGNNSILVDFKWDIVLIFANCAVGILCDIFYLGWSDQRWGN